jgi:hypothetical protein
MKSLSKYILLTLIVVISVLLYIPLSKDLFTVTIAATAATVPTISSSPSFPNHEIIDPKLDWIDLKTKNLTRDGDRSTDIESVDYSSDGHTLNATLWLYFPFKAQPPSSYGNVNYGMFIDADFDDTTGFGGIDYKVEISWNNQSREWTKVLEKWSHFGESLVLDNQTIPYSNFSNNKGAHYVQLSADLDSMLSPKKYKVVFYGEIKKEDSFRTDFTRWVAVPPLELTVSTSPNSVDLKKGEQKTIEVKVNTTQGYEPTVDLYAKSQSKNIILDFTQNDTSYIPNFILRIPSYGIATIPLTITSSEDASIGPHTLFIFAKSSFPPEELIKPKSFIKNKTSGFSPFSLTTPENIFKQSTLLVTLQEPFTLIDHISDFWNKLGAPISFIYGIAAGISPWLFTKIRERSKK